jgi:hypothetical protein
LPYFPLSLSRLLPSVRTVAVLSEHDATAGFSREMIGEGANGRILEHVYDRHFLSESLMQFVMNL